MHLEADPPAVVASEAQRLFSAFEDGAPIDPLTAVDPDLEVDRAYAIQRALIRLHHGAGRTVVGRKIGLTSAAIQAQLGVLSPDYGSVLDTHVFLSGSALSRRGQRMIAPRLEAELAFVLDRPLRGPGISRADVLAATRSIVPVFELIDSRITGWRIRLPDTIADNASCFGVITGAELPPCALDDLAAVGVRIERDGQAVAQGRGSAVLGHPAEAVAWLANHLSTHGERLAASQLVLSGSFSAAVDATPACYRAVFTDPLPPIELTIEE